MMNPKEKKHNRARRHRRIRAKIKGTAARPRMTVFRSNRHVSLQLIDDAAARTLASADKRDVSGKHKGGRVNAAILLGESIAKKAQAAGITRAVFDRGGYRYHGAVRAVADAARKAGLEF